LFSGGEKIGEQAERTYAFYLMLYGSWPVEEGPVEIDGELLASIGWVAEPEEISPEHRFQTLGFMSSMMAARFNELTVTGGRIERLASKSPSAELGFQIPREYQG
jgi:hypothetical protein